MQSLPVIEYFNVLKYILPGLGKGFVMTTMNPLVLQPGEKTLHGGIVIGIAAFVYGTMTIWAFQPQTAVAIQ